MLQIIGFLGCVYLLTKALELFGRAARSKTIQLSAEEWDQLTPDEQNAVRWEQRGRLSILIGAWVATVAVPIFIIWLIVQGNQFPQLTQPTPTVSRADCISRSQTLDEMNRC